MMADVGGSFKYDTQISYHRKIFCAVTTRSQACNSLFALRNDHAGDGLTHAFGLSGDSRLAAKAELITFAVCRDHK